MEVFFSHLEDTNENYAIAKIAGYKLPKSILFTDEVQRAPNGKANYKWAKTFAEEQLS